MDEAPALLMIMLVTDAAHALVVMMMVDGGDGVQSACAFIYSPFSALRGRVLFGVFAVGPTRLLTMEDFLALGAEAEEFFNSLGTLQPSAPSPRAPAPPMTPRPQLSAPPPPAAQPRARPPAPPRAPSVSSSLSSSSFASSWAPSEPQPPAAQDPYLLPDGQGIDGGIDPAAVSMLDTEVDEGSLEPVERPSPNMSENTGAAGDAGLVVEVSSLAHAVQEDSGGLDVDDEQEALWYGLHDQLVDGVIDGPPKKRAAVEQPTTIAEAPPSPVTPAEPSAEEVSQLPPWDQASSSSSGAGARYPFVRPVPFVLTWAKSPPVPLAVASPPLAGLRPPQPASVRVVAATPTEAKAKEKFRGKRGGKNLAWWNGYTAAMKAGLVEEFLAKSPRPPQAPPPPLYRAGGEQ